MAETIRGVTIKIGADTSDFVKGLKKIDKDIKYSEQRARELQNQLQIQYDEKKWQKANKIVQDDLKDTEAKAKAIRKELQYLEKTSGVDTDAYKKISVELDKTETSAEKLNEELEKLNKIKFESAYQGINKLSKGLETAAKKTALVSAAAVGAIAGIWSLGSNAATTGADLQDMADRLDITAEALQRYDYIALQSGVETEQLVKSIAKARDAVGTALAGGTNTASKALQTLFGDLSKIPTGTEEAFTAIIEQLSKVEDSTMQAYYANEIFGERLATNLIPLINNGADRLAQLGEEFESIGYLSDEQVQALADFDDELNIMKERLSLAKTELGIALLPVMKQFADLIENNIVPAIQKISTWFNSLSDSSKKLITTLLLLVAGLSPVLLIISKIVGIIPQLISMLNILSAHPIIAIIGVVAGLLMYLYTTNEKFAKSVNKLLSILSKALSVLFEPLANTLNDIFEMIMPLINIIANLLCPVLDTLNFFLEPIVWALEQINNLWEKAKNGILTLFGKGWLWGKEDNSTTTTNSSSTPSINDYNFTVPSNSNNNYNQTSSNDNYNFNITMNATGNLEYDVNDLVNEVAKKFVLAKQSSGR